MTSRKMHSTSQEKIISMNEIRLPRYKTNELLASFELKVNGKVWPIHDISESGFSLEDSDFFDMDSAIQFEGEITLNNEHAVHRGLFERINKNARKRAFRFVSSPIERHLIEAIELTTSIRNEFQTKGGAKTLPVEYLAFVMELRTFLSTMKRKLDELDNNLRVEAPEIKRSHFKAAEFALLPWFIDQMLTFSKRLNAFDQAFDKEAKQVALDVFRENVLEFYTLSDFVLRSIERPQGYPGDYVLMNKIYDNEFIGGSTFAKFIYSWGINEVSSQAVRYRRGLFTRKMKSLVTRNKINICSVACGPARELGDFLTELDPEVSGKFDFYLLDQDIKALTEAKRRLIEIKITRSLNCEIHFLPISVKQIFEGSSLTQSISEIPFDLIYSSGLYDYLAQNTAKLLTANLYKWLGSTGSLIVGNYNKHNPSHAIGEYVGSWALILRDEKEMVDLVPPEAGHEMHLDDHKVNIYLEIKKPN